MTELVRFGRAVSDLPEVLEFGEWGTMETPAALDAFQETLDYFDQESVITAEKERQRMILAAKRYFDGAHVKPLKVKPGELDDNVLINFCRSLIDDSAAWLFGNPETGLMNFDVEPEGGEEEEEGVEDELEETAEEQVQGRLDAIVSRSGGWRFLKRLAIRGSVAGHFFIKVVPEAEGARLLAMDPLMVCVRTDPVDVDKAIAYKVEWRKQAREPSGRMETYIYRQLVVEVTPAAGMPENERMFVVGDFKAKDRAKRQWQLVAAWAWPYTWCPILDGRNLEGGWGYYGLSDLEDAAGLNDSLNFLASNTLRILKIHGSPKTIGTGVAVEEMVESPIDSFWTIENPDAKVYNLEMQTDLGSSLAMIDFLRTAFWTISRGLDPSVYKDKIGQVTNFALRVLAIRALQKMGDKRQSYGEELIDAVKRALEVEGVSGYEVTIRWPEPLPEDPQAMVSRLTEEVALGVTSIHTASEEIGRSYEQEQAYIQDEKKGKLDLGQFLLQEFDRAGKLDEAEPKQNGSGAVINPVTGATPREGERDEDE